jgi:hypothetical protein
MTNPIWLTAILLLGGLLIFISAMLLVLYTLRWLLDPFSGESPLVHIGEGEQYDED